MVSALASSSLGVPCGEASDVLRLLVKDWDLLKQKSGFGADTLTQDVGWGQ